MDTVQCTVVQDTVGDTEMAGVDAEGGRVGWMGKRCVKKGERDRK